MVGGLRRLTANAKQLINQFRGLLKGTEAKEIEEIVDTALEMLKWVEEMAEILQKENAVEKMMVLLNAGVRIVELIEPLVELIEGNEDSSDVPSWIAVLVSLIRKLRETLPGESDD